jgi:hypothetical protein
MPKTGVGPDLMDGVRPLSLSLNAKLAMLQRTKHKLSIR